MLRGISLGNIAQHLVLAVSGLILLVWTMYFIVSPAKYVLGILLFLITFVAGELLLKRNTSNPANNPVSNAQPQPNSANVSVSTFTIWGDLTAISLGVFSFLVALIPPIKDEIYLNLTDIPLISILRLIAAFGLNFLPGYLILTTFDIKPKLRGLAKLLAAYFISLFIITMTGFAYAQLNHVIDYFYPLTLILINAAIIAVYLIRRLTRRTHLINSLYSVSNKKHRVLLPAVLLGLIVAFKYAWLIGAYENFGFFLAGAGSDMWRNHGFAQSFLDGRAFIWLHIPWWFSLYLASFIIISGVPSISAYLALYPLMILSTIAFYVMASGFTKNRKIATLATFAYTAFSGLAWLYALNMRDFSQVTNYSSWIRIIWQAGGKFLFQGLYPPFTIGFVASDIAYAALWFMVFLAYRLDLRKRIYFCVFTIVAALSYLVHGVDIVVFILYMGAVLLAYLWTRNQEGKKKLRYVAFSVVAALALVAAIELSLTGYYRWSEYLQTWFDTPQYYYLDPIFYSVVGASLIAIIIITYIKLPTQQTLSKLLGHMKIPVILAICFIYIFSIFTWVRELPTFNSGVIGTGPVPWYAYTGTGGIPYLIALAGGVYLAITWKRIKNNTKEIIIFSVLSLALIFIFGKMVSYVNMNFFYTGFWERRILAYLHPIISLLVAYTLFAFSKSIKMKKPLDWAKFVMASFLISLIMLSSVSTTLMALDFTTRQVPGELSQAELEALTYLHYSLPLGLKTAYINRYTGTEYIRAFANDKWTYDPLLYIGQFGSSPQIILNMIAAGNFSLLYLHHTRDLPDLNKNLFIKQLIRVLPVAFNNSEVTIYWVPQLRPPSRLPIVGVVPSDDDYAGSNDAYTLWLFTLAVSGNQYNVIDFSNPMINRSQVLISPYDPLPNEAYTSRLLDWVESGGNLIVSNTNAYGTFSELLGVTTKVPLISGDSLTNWRTLYKRGEILLEPSNMIEGTSSLRMRNNQSSWEEWKYNVTAATGGSNWDLSQYEYLGLWIYSSGGGPHWYLHLTDSNDTKGTYRYDLSRWDSVTKTYVPTFTGWKMILIPIKEYFSTLNLSSIKEMKIVTGTQMPVDMLIDDVFALQGKDTFVVNGVQGKESLSLSEITVQASSVNPDTRVIASYTIEGVPAAPFAVEKSLGAGRIIYLNIKPLYDYLVSGTNERPSHEVLLDVLKVIDFKLPS